MTFKPPTYRQRAIDTSVNNFSALRDLVIDLAEEIDKLIPTPQPIPGTESDEPDQTTENEV